VKISQILHSCPYICYTMPRGKLIFLTWSVYYPCCWKYPPENQPYFEVISAGLLPFPEALQHQDQPELPHFATSRFFSSVFTDALYLRFHSYTASDPIPGWLSISGYFGSCCLFRISPQQAGFMYLLWSLRIWLIYLYKNQIRHSLWPSLASYARGKFVCLLPPGSLSARLALLNVITAKIELSFAFLLRCNLTQFLLSRAALASSLTFRAIRIVSLYLTGLFMPLSCIKLPCSFCESWVTIPYPLKTGTSLYGFLLSGNFPACPFLIILHTGHP